MRAALWLLALFGVAVAAALFAGNNQGTITLYWPPYRIDFSLNMVVLLLVTSFVTVYAALRALAALLELPHQARRWRVQQKERAMHSAMLDALTHMLAGRFIRSRKAALSALVAKSQGGKFGARDLRRVIRKAVEDPAAERIIDGTLKAGGSLTVDAENGEVILK